MISPQENLRVRRGARGNLGSVRPASVRRIPQRKIGVGGKCVSQQRKSPRDKRTGRGGARIFRLALLSRLLLRPLASWRLSYELIFHG